MDKLRIPGGAKLAHAYIAASMNADTRAELGRTLAAAMLCEDDAAPQKPCGHCRACRKTLLGIHPDVITVAPGLDSQGRKRREMTVDQVRAVAATAAVMPNEGRRKAYVIEDADTMNTQAQNALLKLLEEPPESAAFILEAANASLLLPTVRSRCEMIRANADAEASPEAESDARELLGALASARGGELRSGARPTRGWTRAAARPCSPPRAKSLRTCSWASRSFRLSRATSRISTRCSRAVASISGRMSA